MIQTRSRATLRWIGLIALGLLVVTAAFLAGRSGSQPYGAGSSGSVGQEAAMAPKSAATGDLTFGNADMGAPAPDGESRMLAGQDGDSARQADSLVIRTAGISVRVEDMEDALADVRTIAATYGADVTELYLDAPPGDVRPLSEGPTGPKSAQVTVRVPAKDLARMTDDVAALGTVLSQSASASDVTEQHVDLEARLRNLRAEEARLRDFLDRASNVKDLLAVQQELSRVRGEIEAMTAQITYLERQAARATLTISLSEPGPIVSPGAEDWGFRQALTDGLRGAVTLVNAAITAVIAISPVLIAIALGWILVRFARARRRTTSVVADEAIDDGSIRETDEDDA